MKQLEDLGYTEEGDIKNALAGALKTKLGKSSDNSERYQKISGITAEEVKQLVKMDKDIERLFEIQMKKNSKNSEMIRNKISDLNEKPSLRNYLFKKVSNTEMQKDIDEAQAEVNDYYSLKI